MYGGRCPSLHRPNRCACLLLWCISASLLLSSVSPCRWPGPPYPGIWAWTAAVHVRVCVVCVCCVYVCKGWVVYAEKKSIHSTQILQCSFYLHKCTRITKAHTKILFFTKYQLKRELAYRIIHTQRERERERERERGGNMHPIYIITRANNSHMNHGRQRYQHFPQVLPYIVSPTNSPWAYLTISHSPEFPNIIRPCMPLWEYTHTHKQIPLTTNITHNSKNEMVILTAEGFRTCIARLKETNEYDLLEHHLMCRAHTNCTGIAQYILYNREQGTYTHSVG